MIQQEVQLICCRVSKEENTEGIVEKWHLLWTLKDDQKLCITREEIWIFEAEEKGKGPRHGQKGEEDNANGLKPDHWELWRLDRRVKDIFWSQKGCVSVSAWCELVYGSERVNRMKDGLQRWEDKGSKATGEHFIIQVRVMRPRVEAGVRRGRVRPGKTWELSWKETRQHVLWERKKEGWSARRAVRRLSVGAAGPSVANNSLLYGGCAPRHALQFKRKILKK